MRHNLINRKVLTYSVTDSNGITIKKKITFGASNCKRRFDDESLENAFNKIIERNKEGLAGIGTSTIKKLTWEQYQKDDPLNYQRIKANEIENESNLRPEDVINKDTVTIVNPDIVNGSSALVLAGSFSGKTTLIVQAIKNILTHHKKRYDLIIIFSESICALPLNDLPRNDKIQIYPVFIPQLVSFLIRVNQATDLRYSILIVLDDIIKLKSEAVDKLLLVARNSGISTIISTQQIKGISPSARSSVHNIYILGSRNSEEREKMLKMFLRSHLKDKGIIKPDDQENYLRDHTALGENSRKLIKINSIEDRMTIHTIAK